MQHVSLPPHTGNRVVLAALAAPYYCLDVGVHAPPRAKSTPTSGEFICSVSGPRCGRVFALLPAGAPCPPAGHLIAIFWWLGKGRPTWLPWPPFVQSCSPVRVCASVISTFLLPPLVVACRGLSTSVVGKHGQSVACQLARPGILHREPLERQCVADMAPLTPFVCVSGGLISFFRRLQCGPAGAAYGPPYDSAVYFVDDSLDCFQAAGAART